MDTNIKNYRIWRAREIKLLSREEERMKRDLINAAPRELRGMLRKASLALTDLLEKRKGSYEMSLESLKKLGFNSFDDLRKHEAALHVAWLNQVGISFPWDGPGDSKRSKGTITFTLTDLGI